jgi:hypothetical protein
MTAWRRARGMMVAISGCALLGTVAAPVPAATPDLSGVWQLIGDGRLRTSAGEPPRFQAPAAAEHARRNAARRDAAARGDLRQCVPDGVPELMYQRAPFQLLQTATLLLFVHQANHLPRFVYMNTTRPADPDPAHLGHSIGQWDGDTLVIDTAGFRDKSLPGFLGLPHSAALHVVERLTLSADGSVLQDAMTIDDPATYRQPWQAVVRFRRHQQLRLEEDLCALKIEQRPGAKK